MQIFEAQIVKISTRVCAMNIFYPAFTRGLLA